MMKYKYNTKNHADWKKNITNEMNILFINLGLKPPTERVLPD